MTWTSVVPASRATTTACRPSTATCESSGRSTGNSNLLAAPSDAILLAHVVGEDDGAGEFVGEGGAGGGMTSNSGGRGAPPPSPAHSSVWTGETSGAANPMATATTRAARRARARTARMRPYR